MQLPARELWDDARLSPWRACCLCIGPAKTDVLQMPNSWEDHFLQMRCCSELLELLPRPASCLCIGPAEAMPTRGVTLEDLQVAHYFFVGPHRIAALAPQGTKIAAVNSEDVYTNKRCLEFCLDQRVSVWIMAPTRDTAGELLG